MYKEILAYNGETHQLEQLRLNQFVNKLVARTL